jgi:hypothetical protein
MGKKITCLGISITEQGKLKLQQEIMNTPPWMQTRMRPIDIQKRIDQFPTENALESPVVAQTERDVKGRTIIDCPHARRTCLAGINIPSSIHCTAGLSIKHPVSGTDFFAKCPYGNYIKK